MIIAIYLFMIYNYCDLIAIHYFMQFPRLSILLYAILFLSFVFLGVGFGFLMHDSMSSCPFTSSLSFCMNDPLSAISMWRGFFAFTTMVAYTLFVALVFFFLSIRGNVKFLNSFLQPPTLSIPHYLATLFSSGILHPKVF